MAYDETGLLNAISTLIQSLTNYDTSNVSIANTKPLDSGVTRAVILEEGSFVSPKDARAVYMGYSSVTTYRFLVRVYHAYTDDATTQQNLRADVKEIRELLDGYNRVNNNAESAKIIAGSAPQYIGTISGSGPYFMMRELTYEVDKIDAVTNLD